MGLIILLALIGVPILEIAVFIQAGKWIGLWPTVGIVILTAVVGTALLRIQGLSTIARARESLEAGQLPVAEVFDGLCLLIGGALLLTPGFITDALGFLLLIPPVRLLLRRWWGKHLSDTGRMRVWSNVPPADSGSTTGGAGPVIDGEFEEVFEESGSANRDNNKPRRTEKVFPANDPNGHR
jgi:UPF0716 protein FxsA